jgi:hypothetical protein
MPGHHIIAKFRRREGRKWYKYMIIIFTHALVLEAEGCINEK